MIFSDKTPEIKEFETEGRQYLSSIKQLINDVFQAFYTITPKMLDDEDLSPTAKKVNKVILSCLLTQDEYASRKAVCEGCEMPANGGGDCVYTQSYAKIKRYGKSLVRR